MMRGPVIDKQRRNTFIQPGTAIKVIITGLICCGVALQLSRTHKASKPPRLATTADLQQHLQQLAADSKDAGYAAGVLALARDLEKQLAESKELGVKLAKAMADLAATKTVVAKQERTLEAQAAEAAQKQQQLALQLQQVQAQKEAAAAASPPPDPISTAAAVALGPALEQARLQALATAGDACGVKYHAEFWGETLVWGSDHLASDAAECCAACLSHRRTIARGGTEKGRNSTPCNIWVFCGNKANCGEARYGECWLRYQNLSAVRPPALPAGAVSESNTWTSGVIHDSEEAIAFAADDAARQQTAFVMHTSLGDTIEVQLLPELAPKSVREVQRLVAMLVGAPPAQTNSSGQPSSTAGYCSNCRIYRAEKGFLVQGVMEAPGAYVAVPRLDPSNPPQRTVMERGLVCWAGGGGGPHWFVNMIDNGGFKDEHLCFAKVAEQHMAVFENILTLPLKEKKQPNDMNILQEALAFNVSFKRLR